MKSYKQEHELMRRKVWAEAWAATASASNCTDRVTPTRYADAALEAFDKRFPEMSNDESATTELTGWPSGQSGLNDLLGVSARSGE